ncbi:MAG: RNA-binding protein [Betaproteobacteria bacterium]|nr:RNA-binding protein [Betaproteobacteria bacterium]
MTEPLRLAKRVAELMPCSRREAELYIEGGWVRVDGKVIEEPQFRVTGETIVIDSKANLEEPELMTFLYHQPTSGLVEGAISLDNRASDDTSDIRPLKRHFTKLSMVLPLQTGATGLVVMTQDWRVSRKLVDNAITVEQEYVVEVAADVSPDVLKQLNHRVSLRGRALPAAKVSLQSERRLRVALKTTELGQIAEMCRNAGVSVNAIRRLRIGRIAMAKLPPGQWRYLPPGERF